jgi:hypothetical protein
MEKKEAFLCVKKNPNYAAEESSIHYEAFSDV